jgi:hypothetical protein
MLYLYITLFIHQSNSLILVINEYRFIMLSHYSSDDVLMMLLLLLLMKMID